MDFQQQYLEFLKQAGREIAEGFIARDFLASRIVQLIVRVKHDPDDPITWGLLMSAVDDWKAKHEQARH